MNGVLVAALGGVAVAAAVGYVIWLDVTERRKQQELAEWFRVAGADAKARYDEWHVEERGR